ncbi:MAG: hypothetical protein QOH97_2041 [Actinoplanes sp.]|jgi:hypothetical protein|nr:hypothetical protein [Actinoplanes sp.]
MTDNTHQSAPVPAGDVVPGELPVPITVWPVPAPIEGDAMSNAMGVRLVHNLTHPSDLVIDLTCGPQLARAVIAARRRSHPHPDRTGGWGRSLVKLIVTVWPVPVTGWPMPDSTPVDFFRHCHDSLVPGGCVAVLLPHADTHMPGDVILTARLAGLAYLQHVVAADRAPRRGEHVHLDIHTDVLILTRSRSDESGLR